mgnify:CR=1 FL=1
MQTKEWTSKKPNPNCSACKLTGKLCLDTRCGNVYQHAVIKDKQGKPVAQIINGLFCDI